MAKKKDEIKKKLDYLGLNLNKIPKIIREFEPLDFTILKGYDETQYKQYRYIPIRDIQILLSPTNRMDEIDRKYRKASPLRDYLDDKDERNVSKHATFLKMLKSLNVDEINQIEIEQAELNKKIPFKVKYTGNYLWQIYYAENTDKYFMIVPTEDSNYSTFFYLLKKQIENPRGAKIFVPIRDVNYTGRYLKRRMFEELEKNLWEFTKDWPLIYEVFDKSNNLSIQIVGETEVYEKIRSPYRIKLTSKEEAIKFFTVMKAMFILRVEVPQFFKFRTNINRTGGIDFYCDGHLMEYSTMPEFVNKEYHKNVERRRSSGELIKKYQTMLRDLKVEASTLDMEYLAKERQISTFLECKKTFFGKVKYYFKYSKKKSSRKKNEETKIESVYNARQKKEKKKAKRYTKVVIKNNYTIEDLIKLCKEVERIENTMKNLLMDINALKLKNKNMRMKIENATSFIQEIDNHKKSIFEFWKYTNKDEVAALAEGEVEEVNIIKNIKKAFDYEEDLEKFGEKLDRNQRKLLTRDEMDSVFITTTTQFNILNKIKRNQVLPRDVELSLKQIKREQKEVMQLSNEEEFDVFGGLADTKIREINNKRHRETPKDKFKILDVNKNSKQIGYKLTMEKILDNVQKAMTKVRLQEDIIVYKVITGSKLDNRNLNIFDLNPTKELQKAFDNNMARITLFKIHLNKGTNAVGYTNSIYFDNQHKTLPHGMNLDSRLLIDISKVSLEQVNKDDFKIIRFEDEEDDFSKLNMKTINVVEYKQTDEQD